MKEALKEAGKAADLGEVPVGAIIVKDGKIIARGHNMVEMTNDPTEHAEMRAIREAAKVLGSWRLTGCSMFVTLEPCPMCAGAIVSSRLDALYIGAAEPKWGGCRSVFQIPDCDKLNHRVNLEFGILEEECALEMKNFFKNLREKKKIQNSEA